MRHRCVGVAVLVCGCTMTTSVTPPDAGDEGSYTDEEIDDKLADLEAKAAVLAACHEGDALVRDRDGWRCTPDPPCPPGFVASSETSNTVCTRIVGATSDMMVKVGRFWIDRHEMSVCNGQVSTTAVSCSAAGRQPLTGITWFDAAALCANAGKHLCTNAEWQLAAAGTTDPGSSSMVGQCQTAGGLRMTGLADECQSRYGAEDMIGNAWEWVADWRQAGFRSQTSDGAVALWPADYQGDVTQNVNGKTWTGGWNGTTWSSEGKLGLPAAVMRGGGASTNGDSTRSGVFDYNLQYAPSYASWSVGARCCVGGR